MSDKGGGGGGGVGKLVVFGLLIALATYGLLALLGAVPKGDGVFRPLVVDSAKDRHSVPAGWSIR